MLFRSCLAAVGFLLLSGILENKHSSETVEALRPTPEQITASVPDADKESSSTVALPSAEPKNAASEDSAIQESVTEPRVETRIANPYADAFRANNDMAAWLQIPDTNIDYPVMWTPEDESYYLYRDFDGSDNKNGCLILEVGRASCRERV